MSKTKKLLIALMLLIAILLLPNMVNAAVIQATETTTTSTGKTVSWSYELDSNNNIIDLKCTNISAISGDLTIPSTIDGYTVLTIGNTKNGYDDGAFQECSGLTGITIPNTVTTIGYRAFYNCTGLKSLTLPDSITSIQSGAFASCTGLKTVTLSENIASIGSSAFSGCSGFKTIVIPDSVTTIGESAFRNCTGLTSLTLSKNLTKINNLTFAGCTGLTSVIIPESVTTIDGGYSWQGSFGGCTNLEKVLIPDSVATIGENAFVDCSKLTIYGNDGQTSKSFAEQYNINFKYISQWNASDVGDDITPPSVESIEVPHSSVSKYYDSNSTTYIVPSGKVLIINVNFSENILGTQVPTLKIKFGNGSDITLAEGTVSGSTVAYTYTIARGDIGTMTAVSLIGGNITDEAGNEATLTCPAIRVSLSNHYIYANGTAIDVEDKNENTNKEEYISFPYIIYFGTTTIDLKQGAYDGDYTMYYQFVEVTNENEETKYDDTKWVEMKDRKPEAPSLEFTGEKKFDLWIKLVMKDKTVYESYRYKFNGSTPVTTDTEKKTFNNHSYQIIDKKMSWQEAKEYCESLGGYLVTITSAEEQTFITSLIKEQGFSKNRFWIGATDKDKEGTWKWVTGEKFSYTNWGNSQPSGGGQNYGALVAYDTVYNGIKHLAGQWDNIEGEGDSDKDIYFICEWGEPVKDTTTAPNNLPSTGRVLLFWIIGIVAVSGIVARIRYKKLYM